MFNIAEITNWRKTFGLFSALIKPGYPEQYALLNGGRNDFCIDLNPDKDTDLFNSFSWSANTKSYIAISNDDVTIYQWLKAMPPEKIKRKHIENNITAFYNYLGRNNYQTENDVVPFIINTFRQMRNITRERDSPVHALNLLYRLLLSLEMDIEQLNCEQFALENINLPYQFEHFVETIRAGVGTVKPDLKIILRHCSGPIFQEAHREVQVFHSDRDLFGDISNRLITSSQGYSSAHYTPQYVIRSIVEQCIKRLDIQQNTITIFDPACGSGEFLLETLKQLYDKQYEGNLIVRGWDCSESAISTSRFLLNYEKKTIWREKLSIDIRLVQDSLTEDWANDTDLILMNPPFVSWELLSSTQRDIVSSCFSSGISKPNQAIAFLKKAIESTKQNGILGCVLPTSLFTSDTYKTLRYQMKEELNSCLVGKLGNFIFDNALTDVSIYVGKKPATPSFTKLLWCKNENGVAQEALCALRRIEANDLIGLDFDSDRFSIYSSLEYPDKQDSWKVISQKECILKERLANLLSQGTLTKLQSIFTVKQGIRTGNNALFIIDSPEYDKLSPKEKTFYRKSVDNDAIFYSKLDSKHYVWYPYDHSGLLINTENQLELEAPMTFGRLFQHKEKLERRTSLNDQSKWWALSRHREWLLKKECRLISTEFGNSKSFAIDLNGDYVIERGHAWIPKKTFKQSDYFFYLSIFSSPIFETILSIYTRQLAGGAWYDLSAKYTNPIPIPDVSKNNLRTSKLYSELTILGKVISNEGSYFYSDRINELVKKILMIDDYD